MADGVGAATADQTLDALGDRTRRQVLDQLRGGERTVADLTRALPVSQSAVSQHLRVLKDAGLVTDRPAGTRRYYRVTVDGFAPLRAYLDSFWDEVLDAFTGYAADAARTAHEAQNPTDPTDAAAPPPEEDPR